MEKGQTKRKGRKVSSKLCVKCSQVYPLADFYSHKEWVSQGYRDAWCKSCVEDYCKDKESLEQYCIQNNRRWDDSFWDSASKKAQYVLASNAEYISPRTSTKKREEILNKTTCKQFFSMMGMPNFYGYVENVGADGVYVENFEKRINGEAIEEPEPAQRTVYDKVWRGYYTEEQIEILNAEYARYEEDFVLDNVNIRDYARKVIKASLDADIAADKARRGEISSKEAKERQDNYDNLSKSANFAACKRKPGEARGAGSQSEITFKIESMGLLENRGYTGPKDAIDLAIEELDHRMVAAGLRGEI